MYTVPFCFSQEDQLEQGVLSCSNNTLIGDVTQGQMLLFNEKYDIKLGCGYNYIF